ncbi:hypothetical protein B0A55_04625 [Friedmanniomyces simplex]|uniref:EKC/KEOPS complex subunit BUD32 n=1 Tax=Friedmanniomyces simplex TaxID=329884 RepID=A0A4U0XKA0_9PEZI|nr:hypothetical protein B0A55_04625 [Friedmanniomyces simplex]
MVDDGYENIPVQIPKGELLGCGISAIVELLPNGNVVKSPWNGEEAEECRQDLSREAAIYAKIYKAFGEHDRFVRFIAFNEESSEVILQYMPNGTLRDYLHSHGDCISHPQRLRWVSAAAEALEALHSIEVIHCDFSPKNLLLDADLTLKVADFGCSAIVGQPSSGMGSCRFYPPLD